MRDLNACIAEELRRLDPDEVYGEVITTGLRDVRIAQIVDTAGELTPGAARFLAEHGGRLPDRDRTTPDDAPADEPAEPDSGAVPAAEASVPAPETSVLAPGEERA